MLSWVLAHEGRGGITFGQGDHLVTPPRRARRQGFVCCLLAFCSRAHRRVMEALPFLIYTCFFSPWGGCANSKLRVWCVALDVFFSSSELSLVQIPPRSSCKRFRKPPTRRQCCGHHCWFCLGRRLSRYPGEGARPETNILLIAIGDF